MNTAVSVYKNDKLEVDANIDFVKKEIVLKFKGALNEKLGVTTILNYLFGVKNDIKKFVLDLSQIDYINSVGAEKWIGMIKTLQTKGMEPTFVHVSEFMVERASILPWVFGKPGTQVVSFEAPYYCPKCSNRVIKLLEVAVVKAQGLSTLQPYRCESCKGPLELDEVESTYFHFLRHVM